MGRIPHRPGGPWPGILLAASVLGSCLQLAPAQTPVTIVLTPPSPPLGGGVSLAPQPTPQNLQSCSWYRSATNDGNSRILTYFPAPPVQNNGSAHTGRETAGPGCVLHIAGLMLNYTGSYTVQIQSRTSPGLGSVHLPVYEKLAKPTVTPNQNQVPENGTLTLTCNTSPSADTVLWLQNGSYNTPNKRLGLSPDNRTLTVQNFTWGDTGTYQCEVRNPVSSERSEPSTVTLAHGPESARIDPPGPVNLTLGSRLTLTCVTDSVPAPSYSWFLNGNKLPQTGSSLTFDLTTLNLGTYKCQADNPVTGLTANAEIEVLEKLAKPTVTASKTQVPENGTLTLTCNTSPSADTVLWLQNGSSIAPNKRLGLSPDNRTLTVQNFTWGDTGTYQCEVRNPVSTERSEPSTVTLAYGPESARIDPPGPVNLTLGSRLTLTCVADSVPAPSYSWFLNGNKLPQTGSSLTFDLTTLNLGTYKCQADNPVTGLTANAEIEVLEKLAKPTVTSNQNQMPENGTLTLTCNTSPSADTVLWLQNGSYIAPNKRLGLSPDNRTLTVQNFSWGDAGTYQCEVRNPVSTERSEPSTVTLAYAPRPGLSAGAVAGIVIGSLAGAALVGVLAYFLYSRCRNETPRENEAPVPVYENLPPTAGAGPVAQPRSPPDPSPTYQTLQPRQPDVYEELKK
ncbi:carcinoembryonic antigen-related cell adhesion molecule 1-like isoform X2 [Mauremys reevesii]|uniref:carcinoembryonic antigen-related cell adhesion molecule 1-like isoform X2 n=1 Tax=Mauremys reevesii TaxID=260615 RepID=UPI00193F69C3|nr:carcinoembryonic antigen-related cell adhesion molecule 1-like isoform X2 [Mauremys reevesii]